MEDFVPYELAVKLKEKGFNEQCYAYYEPLKHCLNLTKVFWINSLADKYNCVIAPTISQVLKWLRKTHNLFITVFINDDTDKPLTYEIYKETDCLLHHHGRYFSLEDWDKANLDAIKYVIDNLI